MEERIKPPHIGTEREMLDSFMAFGRTTVLQKISGLTTEQAHQSMAPSTMTVLGLVKHLAYVERHWFQDFFLGLDVDFPWSPEDSDSDFRAEPDETVESIVALYRQETASSVKVVASANLDDLSKRTGSDGQPFSLRWIIFHMLEEIARHNGHLDIFRERIDGVTGF